MSNPWAQSFEELRSPYLQEKKAKKDYDGDGKVESGAKEYRGVIHNKIQKAKGGKADGQDTSSVKEHHQKDANGTITLIFMRYGVTISIFLMMLSYFFFILYFLTHCFFDSLIPRPHVFLSASFYLTITIIVLFCHLLL